MMFSGSHLAPKVTSVTLHRVRRSDCLSRVNYGQVGGSKAKELEAIVMNLRADVAEKSLQRPSKHGME